MSSDNNKVDLLLSQSKWANPDEIPSAMFLSRPQSENEDESSYHYSTGEESSALNTYSSEADQRAADKLDALLSNIEKRVEASQELEKIQARVHDSLVSYHSPYPQDMFSSGGGGATAGGKHPSTSRLRGKNNKKRSKNTNSYQGLSLETRQRISTTSRTDMETQLIDMQGRSNRVGSTLNDVSRWFGHATSVGLDITSSQSKLSKKRRRDATNKGAATGGATPESTDISVDELQTEEGLRRHMEALDRMMSSVREAATTLQDTHQQVLAGTTRRLDEERKALSNAEGNWSKQLQTAKSKLSKKNIMYKKQEGILTGLKSALRESQLIVERQAVENKSAKEDATALKKQIRRLRRDVEDAEGIHKKKREEAEQRVEVLDETVTKRDGEILGLKSELDSILKRLAAAPPKILTPTKNKINGTGSGEVDVDVEQKNAELRKRHQIAMDRLAQDHDSSVKRLKQQMMRMESGVGADKQRQLRDLERVLQVQKQRWIAALESQRTQFEMRAEEMKEELTGNGLRAARQLKKQQRLAEEDHKKKTAELKQTLTNIMARNDAETFRLQKTFQEEKEDMERTFFIKLSEAKDSATSKLGEIMQAQQDTMLERDKWQAALQKASLDLLDFQAGAEKQRLKLATAMQTIEGLKYQVRLLQEDAMKKQQIKLEAETKYKEAEAKLLSLEAVLSGGGGFVDDNGMRLTTEEAQEVITTLGNRVSTLEEELESAEATIVDLQQGEAGKKRGGPSDALSLPAGYRHFQKYSYMPAVMEGLGKSLTSCGQLAHTLFLLREAPGWMEEGKHKYPVTMKAMSGEDDVTVLDQKIATRSSSSPPPSLTIATTALTTATTATTATATTTTTFASSKRKENLVSLAPGDIGYDWSSGWTEHLDALSTRMDQVSEFFRNALTTLRAEMAQREQYEEIMCLHFYNRELHWKGLYEAMVRAVQKARGEPKGGQAKLGQGTLRGVDQSIRVTRMKKSTRKKRKKTEHELKKEKEAKEKAEGRGKEEREAGEEWSKEELIKIKEAEDRAAAKEQEKEEKRKNKNMSSPLQQQEQEKAERSKVTKEERLSTTADGVTMINNMSPPIMQTSVRVEYRRFDHDYDGIDRGSSFDEEEMHISCYDSTSTSRTPSWLPRGVGSSGAVILERSRAGARIDMIPSSENIHGWTPVPPSSAGDGSGSRVAMTSPSPSRLSGRTTRTMMASQGGVGVGSGGGGTRFTGSASARRRKFTTKVSTTMSGGLVIGGGRRR